MTSKRFTNTRLLGRSIETWVARELKKQGLKLVQENYSCRSGEIDLIMMESPAQLVFVEVRFRSVGSFGSALESVDIRKQQKLKRAAAYFLLHHPGFNSYPARFDVVAVHPSENRKFQGMEWVKNAFY